MNIEVTISDEGKRILESWLGVDQIHPWLQHAIDNKLRQRLDASIREHTDKNPEKMTGMDKLAILRDVGLPTKEERDIMPKKMEKEII